jgi:23S rRNA pseudouridine1911/1915/1917 synthase
MGHATQIHEVDVTWDKDLPDADAPPGDGEGCGENAHIPVARAERRRAFGDPNGVVMRWQVPPDAHGKDAVFVLAHKVRRLGLERARSVVEVGDFRVVDGDASHVVGVGHVLARGTMVEVWRLAPDRVSDMTAAPGIVHEGGGLIVVDKPGDLAVHPSARYLHATLTGWLSRRGTPANPCHRLDRETSGVLVCANVTDVERRWKQAFSAGDVKKTYVAVVDGVIDAPQQIALPLALQGERGLVRIRMVVDDDGAVSVTDVDPIAVSDDGRRSLIRCHPQTGRQHQLRAHLAAIGHPIVGDKLYQMGDAWFDAFTRRALSDEARAALVCPRQCLHAESLRLGDETFFAPVPSSFAEVLASPDRR